MEKRMISTELVEEDFRTGNRKAGGNGGNFK